MPLRLVWPAALVVLLLVAAAAFLVTRPKTIAASAGPASGVDPAVTDGAKRILLSCQEDDACQTKDLRALTGEKGAAFALLVLDEMGARNARVLSGAHVLAHEIGYEVYARFPSLAERLKECRDNAASGCFHGVMMQHIGKNGAPTKKLVATACDEVRSESPALYFQCLHGVGHGVTMGQILTATKAPGLGAIRTGLDTCDAMSGEYERRSCYGGMFMEYFVAATNPIFHYAVKPTYPADNPNWPCDMVADKYVPDCYAVHGRRILDLAKWDYKKAFETCATAPVLGRGECVSNIGRDVNSMYRGRPVDLVGVCNLTVDGEQRGWCLAGAVRETINYNVDIPAAVTLCKAGAGEGQSRCIEALRGDARFHGWTPERLAEEFERQGLDAPL